MRQFDPFTPVTLTWEDAFHNASSQHDSITGALRDYSPVLRKTIGYYVGEGEKNGRRCVVICTDDDREKPDDECVGGPFYCPIGMVIRIEPLPPVKPKRKRKR